MSESTPPEEGPGPKKLRPCPICGKPGQMATKPFCSPRCADVDLHRWLGGVYSIPGGSALDEEDSMLPGSGAEE